MPCGPPGSGKVATHGDLPSSSSDSVEEGSDSALFESVMPEKNDLDLKE